MVRYGMLTVMPWWENAIVGGAVGDSGMAFDVAIVVVVCGDLVVLMSLMVVLVKMVHLFSVCIFVCLILAFIYRK